MLTGTKVNEAKAVDVPLIDLQAQYASIREELDRAVADVIHSQRFVLGEPVERLEAAMAELVGARHAVGCASGTDALLLPLKLLADGGDVIVPAFTFFATAGAVHNAGLRPVFCDVDPVTFNVTRELVEAAWTNDTVGILPVHLFGQMAPMDELRALASERGVFLFEDAAQAIGAWQRTADGSEAIAGSAADLAAFSFFPTKNLGAFGEGGMITTDDDRLAEALRKYRVHGGIQMYHHEMVGTNSRLQTLQAAVLLAKLPHLDDWSRARAANAARYRDGLLDVEGIVLPVTADGNHHVFNQFTLRTERRDELREFLSARGVGSGVYYPAPLHLQTCFASLGYGEGDLPTAESLVSEVISLPVSPEMGTEQQDWVMRSIREFYGAA